MPELWINPQGGASGDMFLSALIDLGVDSKYIIENLESLKLKQTFKIDSQHKTLRGFAGIQTHVHLDEIKQNHKHHHHVTHRDICQWIEQSNITDQAKMHALAIFHTLAEAEAEVHGKPVDSVAFHEVGATDSIVDIVGTAIALDHLNIHKLYSSPVGLGSGTVQCAHGVLPLPAPATILILRDCPVFSTGEEKEMCTPTGAAILKTLASFDPIPGAYQIKKVGLGLSHSIPKQSPPFLRCSIIEREQSSTIFHEHLVWLSCNLDDMNPEYIPMATERLQKLGALDVSLCPILMKKGRSGHELRALIKPEQQDEAIKILLEWTSSFGVRVEHIERYALKREMINVDTPWGPVRVKRGYLPKEQMKHHIEYDDVKAICDQHQVSWREVIDSLQIN